MNYNRKLVLADSTVFPGNGFGSSEEVVAEVIFHTGMTGYEHILTDPAYTEQAVVMTYPMVGNYGISQDEMDADSNGATALIVKEYCEIPSNWRMVKSINEYMVERKIVGLSDVDTRALTIKIRETGTMRGIIVDENTSTEAALEKLNEKINKQDSVKSVAPIASYKVVVKNKKFRVAYVALGATSQAVIEELVSRSCEVIVIPATRLTVDVLQSMNPDGILIGNGPGNPKDVLDLVPVIAELQKDYSIFGIGLGFQLIALANGATTSKMTFGHHGANVPVKDTFRNRTFITQQNHLFMVDNESLANTNLVLTQFALNDNTVQGVTHAHYPVFGVQYMPEVHTGPADSKYLFDQFVDSLVKND